MTPRKTIDSSLGALLAGAGDNVKRRQSIRSFSPLIGGGVESNKIVTKLSFVAEIGAITM